MTRRYAIVAFGPPDLTKRAYFARMGRKQSFFVKGDFDRPADSQPGDKYRVRTFPGPVSARKVLAKVAAALGYHKLPGGDFYGKGESRLTLMSFAPRGKPAKLRHKGGKWRQVKGWKDKNYKKYSPHPRADVVAARVRMIKQASSRAQIAALLRRFRAVDRGTA